MPERIRVAGEQMSKALLHRNDPVYRAAALNRGISGTDRLHVLIGKDGKVLNAEPISGDPLLLQAATDRVRTSAYKRASTQGVPVEVDTSVEIVFDPERRNSQSRRIELQPSSTRR